MPDGLYAVAELAAGRVPGERQRRIEEAFETLGDPIARLRYDGHTFVPPPRRQRFLVQTSRQRTVPRRQQARSRRRLLLLTVNPLLVAGFVLAVAGAAFVLLVPLFRGSNLPPAEQASTPSVPASARSAGAGQPNINQPPSVLRLPANAAGSGQSLLAPSPAEPLFVSQTALPSAVIAVAAASLVVSRPAVTTPPSAAPTTTPTRPPLVIPGSPTPAVGALATSTSVRLTGTAGRNRIFVPTAAVARSVDGGAASVPAFPVSSPSASMLRLP